GERARRGDAGGLEPGDLAPHHGDRRMAGDPIVHSLRECDAVYGERRTTGHAGLVGGVEHHAPEAPHLGLEQPVGVGELHRFEGVEQTSSASRSVWCAAVMFTGRISCSVTAIPRSASAHAASLPASPPPTTTALSSPPTPPAPPPRP